MLGLVRAVCLWVVLLGAGLVVLLTAGVWTGGLLLTRGFLWVVLVLTDVTVRVAPAVFCSTDLLLQGFERGIVCLGSFGAKRGETGRPFLDSKCSAEAGEGGRLWASRERTGAGGGRASRWAGFCTDVGGAEGLGSLQVGSGQTGLRG